MKLSEYFVQNKEKLIPLVQQWLESMNWRKEVMREKSGTD